MQTIPCQAVPDDRGSGSGPWASTEPLIVGHRGGIAGVGSILDAAVGRSPCRRIHPFMELAQGLLTPLGASCSHRNFRVMSDVFRVVLGGYVIIRKGGDGSVGFSITDFD